MNTAFKAIETTGKLENRNHIILDEPLSLDGSRSIKVIILFTDDDIDEQSWLKAAAANPAFDFLKSPGEDIYTDKDGKPFHVKR